VQKGCEVRHTRFGEPSSTDCVETSSWILPIVSRLGHEKVARVHKDLLAISSVLRVCLSEGRKMLNCDQIDCEESSIAGGARRK
jgi:hypothetical protein